jgi:hypothetical protein
LIELIIAGVIAALLTAATTYTVSRALDAKTAARGRQQALGRADAALAHLTREAAAIVRAEDPMAVLVKVVSRNTTDDNGVERADDELLLFNERLRPVRPASEQAEGGEYESQFRIIREPDEPPTLWHRRDPGVDEYFDAGGVAKPLVEHIVALDVKVFDGAEWIGAWDSDELGIPLGLRFQVTATSDDGRAVLQRRAVVSFDRTPLPISVDEELEELEGVLGAGGGE